MLASEALGVLSVMNLIMLVMQGSRVVGAAADGVQHFLEEKINTGWVDLDELFNSHIPTGLIVIAALMGFVTIIFGIKTIDKVGGTR